MHDQKRDEIMTEVAKLLFPERKEELEATSTMDAATVGIQLLTPSADKTLHLFPTLLFLTFYQITRVSMEHLLWMWHAERERLLL